MADKEITLRDIIIDACVIAMTLYSIYVSLDQATDGRFGRECSIRFTKFQSKITSWIKREREFDSLVGDTIWRAINIVERGEEDPRGNQE